MTIWVEQIGFRSLISPRSLGFSDRQESIMKRNIDIFFAQPRWRCSRSVSSIPATVSTILYIVGIAWWWTRRDGNGWWRTKYVLRSASSPQFIDRINRRCHNSQRWWSWSEPYLKCDHQQRKLTGSNGADCHATSSQKYILFRVCSDGRWGLKSEREFDSTDSHYYRGLPVLIYLSYHDV